MTRSLSLLFPGGACLALALLLLRSGTERQHDADGTVVASEGSHLAAQVAQTVGERPWPRSTQGQHPVLVRQPAGPPRIALADTDPQGRPAEVACSTCHSVRKPNFSNVSASTLDEFHQGMTFQHGTITCYACHNSDGSDTLRIADGRSVAYQEVLQLCSQCHSPQAIAFEHGAHGGMNGYWDLSRGPQIKNNCVDCHDPHAPAYPKMVVGFKPHDRFNTPLDSHEQHAGAESHAAH